MSTFHKLSKDDVKNIIKDDQNAPKKKLNVPMLIVHILEIILSVAYVVLLVFGKLFVPADNTLYQSFNIFNEADPEPMIRLLSYAMFVLVIGTLLRIILGKLSTNEKLTKKMSIALIQLFANLVKYVMFIIIACLALNAIGIHPETILAGLGIVGLVIGLGVTSLIEDIVAGIFIIAERLFDVGDIVVIDGFRGKVVSIGIRSTKLADVGGDILTMRNSSIGSLVNLTDRQSCAALTIPIAPDESLQKVEQIIKDSHIENIKNTCDKIIGDPLYLGLCDINAKGVQMLLFIAGCKEDDRYDVERALYHGIKVMLESNGIKLGAPALYTDDQE